MKHERRMKMTVRIDRKSLKQNASFDVDNLQFPWKSDSEAAFVAEAIVEIEKVKACREMQPKAS